MGGENELSFSNTVLIVYIVSGVIFVLLVLSLFIMDLAPVAPCCRCTRTNIPTSLKSIQHQYSLITPRRMFRSSNERKESFSAAVSV